MTREEAISELKQFSGVTRLKLSANFWNALDMAIKALEQESCDDCISRAEVLSIYDEWFATCDIADNKTSPKAKIKALPPVQPKTKTGHWIYENYNWRCSKCNESPKTMGYVGTADFMREHFKFCNHCGARMVDAPDINVGRMSEIQTGSESEE